MDGITKALSDLQNKAENCSKSDRLITLDFLKKLINDLENVDNETIDDTKDDEPETTICTVRKSETNKDSRQKLPLKLTIRKFKNVESNFLCHECHKTFITMKKMISHVLNSHTKAEVTCRICKGTFYCYNLLIIHECLYPRQTVFIHRQCGICAKLFLQKREYHLHMKDEHMLTLDKCSKSFTCHICQMNFQLRSQLLAHASQSHMETCFDGDLPVNKFLKISQNGVSNDNDIGVAITKPKSVIKSRNWCSVCKRNFLSQKALNKHFLSYMHKVNTGELKMFKKFVCDVCNNSFNKMICLQRHVSSHHNEFAHKCNLCDYRTSEKCNLTEHMRRHYQIRNFACEFCDARFIAKRELKDHVAFKHNSLRPFECSDCGKMFKTKRILRRHAKTHSEFRPYVCACGSSFLRMTNLRRHHLAVHHESNPTVTKVQVADDVDDEELLKDYWYADSKSIKNKKTTPLTLKKRTENIESPPRTEVIEPQACTQQTQAANVQMLNVNYIVKVTGEHEKDSKMYWSVHQNFLDGSDGSTNQAVDGGGAVSSKSSMHESSVIEDAMNICDLVPSPSYPLLASADQCDDRSPGSKMVYELSVKTEGACKYQVDSLIMDADSRGGLDGIWRPIDPADDPSSSMGSMATHGLDMFPHSAGLISSFNEVFLSSDAVQWNGLSLANQGGYVADQGGYLCEPGPDASSVPNDHFLYYGQPPPTQQQHAYIETYSSGTGVEHAYGSVHDSFGPGLAGHHQHHVQDLFALSYSSTASAQFVQVPPHSSAASGVLFSQDQLFQSPPSLQAAQSQVAHGWQHSPGHEPYKLSSHLAAPSSAGHHQHPLRVLSPIDFFVSDAGFQTGIKHEYCLSLQHLPAGHDMTPLMSDFCSQAHPFVHTSAQLCSKNFSVVNLISTACAHGNKEADDNDLLYSGPEESVM